MEVGRPTAQKRDGKPILMWLKGTSGPEKTGKVLRVQMSVITYFYMRNTSPNKTGCINIIKNMVNIVFSVPLLTKLGPLILGKLCILYTMGLIMNL